VEESYTGKFLKRALSNSLSNGCPAAGKKRHRKK
jgi:hypothetical protein